MRTRGDNEVAFLFDPENDAVSAAVCRVGGKIPRRRVVNLTDEQRASLRERITKGKKGSRLDKNARLRVTTAKRA